MTLRHWIIGAKTVHGQRYFWQFEVKGRETFQKWRAEALCKPELTRKISVKDFLAKKTRRAAIVAQRRDATTRNRVFPSFQGAGPNLLNRISGNPRFLFTVMSAS